MAAVLDRQRPQLPLLVVISAKVCTSVIEVVPCVQGFGQSLLDPQTGVELVHAAVQQCLIRISSIDAALSDVWLHTLAANLKVCPETAETSMLEQPSAAHGRSLAAG